MSTKQILLIGGGTAFGAVAAVALMKARPSENDGNPKPILAVQSVTEAAKEKPKAEDSSRESEVAPIVEEIVGNASEIDVQELNDRGDELREGMKERQMTRLTNKMAKWSAALGLNKGQQEKLLEVADAQFEELETLAATTEDGAPAVISESAKRAMAIMSGRALEESMVAGLTPAQQQKYEQFDSRQNASRAEARTLRQLATLQEDLMLTPEQRNDVYGILYDDSIKQVEGDSDVTSMIDEFSSQAGVSIDPSLQGMIASLASRGLEEMASGNQLDEESVRGMAENALSDSINQQVEQLSPALTEAQLELYRSQLEGRLSNLSNMIPRGQSDE